MYCKECGKEIANDAKYCSYCGTSQQDIYTTVDTKDPKMNEELLDIQNVESTLIIRMKRIRPYFLGWSMLNIVLFAIGKVMAAKQFGCYNNAEFNFFPFGNSQIYDYDFYEFAIYVFILPIVVYLLFLIIKKLDR